MDQILRAVENAPVDLPNVYVNIVRWIIPVLVAVILYRCAKPLLSFRREPEIWAWLRLSDGSSLPVTHWENVIGRSRKSDIVIDLPTVSRNHAVLTRYDDGSWTIGDADSKDGVEVNGKPVAICALEPDDVISIGGCKMKLDPISRRQEIRLAQIRTKAASPLTSTLNLILLTLVQLLSCFGFLLNGEAGYGREMLTGFGGIIVAQWVLLLFYFCIRRTSFEVETLAFFLCTMGMSVICATVPDEAVKQLTAMVIGLFAFLILGGSLRDLELAKRMRYLATIAGVGFLLITLVFGQEIYGAKNWLIIGGTSIQPAELTKVCFVFAGASTMDRIMQKRNLILFIAYSAMLCCLLALMNDFGTALVFFVAFLSIAYMRSGSIGTIALAVSALVFACVIVLNMAPHALDRFAAYRHIWEDPLDAGYQQTQSLMCMAAGGLMGLGPGNGLMKNLFASDSDVVFATIGEEWGLIMAMMVVCCIIVLSLFTLRSAGVGRSSFYTISSCTAASILLVQTILNVLGTVDLLPFTGVTFPFVSNGGSSMIASWALLAFVKAADTRQNASFAIRLSKEKEDEEE